jgi:ribokinase
MIDLFVIGGASLDVLHLPGRSQPVEAAGGAALYTAAAAQRAGAVVVMLAPRPDPAPPMLQPAAAHIPWIGPTIPPDQLPRLEIAHYGGGKAALIKAMWGAEPLLTPDHLPNSLSDYKFVHVAALRSAQRQLSFLHSCRKRGATRISAGTYSHVVRDEPATVRDLLEQADLFFMNENEALGLFGSVNAAGAAPNKVLFITLGARGALVIDGNRRAHIPGQPAQEVDPTGAGDTFCGATLAGLARGESPVMAARQAIALAAEVIGAIGPAALWRSNHSQTYAATIDP